MRSALVLGATLALLAAALPGAAQSPPALATPPSATVTPVEGTVTVPEAAVYSGPGDKFYVTSKLRQGEKVVMLRPCPKDTNWIEIRPPKGSFSWVSSTFILRSKADSRIGLVVVPEGQTAPALAGSEFHNAEPNIEVAKLERGTQVVILEDKQNYAPGAGASLIRIEASALEVRYVKAECLDQGLAIQRAAAGAGPGLAGGTAQTNDLMQQAQRLAQQAQADPRLDEQRRQQVLAYLKQAEDIMRNAGAPGGTAAPQMPGNPNNVAAAANAPPTGLLASRQGATGQNTAQYNANPSAAAKAPLVPGQPQWKWSSWGTLRKAGFKDDGGRPMYVLSDPKGGPLLYAVPEPGKTLDPYLGSMVALYGSTVYRSDEFIRGEFITVSYVAPPQNPNAR